MYYLLAGVELAVFVNVLICHSGVHLSRIVHSTVTYVLDTKKDARKTWTVFPEDSTVQSATIGTTMHRGATKHNKGSALPKMATGTSGATKSTDGFSFGKTQVFTSGATKDNVQRQDSMLDTYLDNGSSVRVGLGSSGPL